MLSASRFFRQHARIRRLPNSKSTNRARIRITTRLTVSMRRRFAQRFQFEANYTFASNRDDDSNERNFSRETTLNPFNLKAEEGPSKQDVRHNLNLSGLVDLGRGFTISAIVDHAQRISLHGVDRRRHGHEQRSRMTRTNARSSTASYPKDSVFASRDFSISTFDY